MSGMAASAARRESTDVFITLRFAEAKSEGNLLKLELTWRGIIAYMDETGPGQDIHGNIATALVNTKLAVILATRTYGMQTGGVFDTPKEMDYILGNSKPYVLVKMRISTSLDPEKGLPWIQILNGNKSQNSLGTTCIIQLFMLSYASCS